MVAPRRAAAALLEAEKFVIAREAGLMEEIISRYRGGRLDHDFVVGRIGEVSAGRHLITEMKRALAQEIGDG